MAVATDVNDIFSRLFDHRPFLKTEISFFKREFEDKRGDQEVEQLFRALELTTEIKEAQLDKVIEACDDHLPRTIADIEVALRMCETTLDLRSRAATAEKEAEKRRKERNIRLEAVKSEIQTKLAAIDSSFDLKETELRDSFAKLQLEAQKNL